VIKYSFLPCNKYYQHNLFCVDIVLSSTMADVYELSKSEQIQDLDRETPYESKQWNFVNDINSGVYTNSQQSLVQFDLQVYITAVHLSMLVKCT
jgi:hypothetical protein